MSELPPPTAPLPHDELPDLSRVREQFDISFYSKRYFDGQPPLGIDLFSHYLFNVRARKLDPSSSFSEAFYLEANPDVEKAVKNGEYFCGFHHYLTYGRQESRTTSPALSENIRSSVTASPHSSVALSSPNSAKSPTLASEGDDGESRSSATPPEEGASIDFFCDSSVETRIHGSPFLGFTADDLSVIAESGLFEFNWYRTTYNISFVDDLVLLRDFLERGYLEGHQPNPYFDPLWYLESNVDVALANVNPLIHYVEEGELEGRQPILYFDSPWYRTRYSLDKASPLAHFLSLRNTGTVSPNSLFDPTYYIDKYPDVKASGLDPFMHYLLSGYREGRDPSAEFVTTYYVVKHLKQDWSVNPLIHYLIKGRQTGLSVKADRDEQSCAGELRKYTQPGEYFEEFSPHHCAGNADIKLLAYYLPQFHAFPENDKWWGTGFTEWTNIARGSPRFVGHYQPRVPRDLGFYDLANSEVMAKQVALAKASGLFGFCFYYYWFNGVRLMDKPINRFLHEENLDFSFCLMWANENWTRRWDGADSEILIAQDYAAGDDEKLVADLAVYMIDRRYIRINGRPLLMIYRPGIIPECQNMIARLKEIFLRCHGERPIFVMAQAFNDVDPAIFGFDGAIEFPPHKLVGNVPVVHGQQLNYLDYDFSAQVYEYDDVVQESLAEPAPSFPLIKTIVPSWDNDARRQGHGLVITNSTPAKYEGWLRELAARARKHPFFGEPLVCVNAWNEWCEGAYLEPDLHFGSAYLNATSRAIARPVSLEKTKVLLVGHDAFPGGAQHLLLGIGRLVKQRFGAQIAYALLGGGRMVNLYRELAPVDIIETEAGLASMLKARSEEAFQYAIVNTTASAKAAAALERAGLSALLLVHEAPRIMEQKGLVESARLAMRHVKAVIFGSRYLADRFEQTVGLQNCRRVIVQPQGLYNVVKPDAKARLRVRAQLKIGASDLVILNAGYADLRKGFDIFLQMWRYARAQRPSIHFIWAGDLDPEAGAWLSGDLDVAVAEGTFHHIPFTAAVADYFAACDVFALTSREDPYPSVVLEAISADKPVVVFADAGGIPEIVTGGIGRVVPYADVPAMLAAAIECGTEQPSPKRSAERAKLIEDRFDFARYCWGLLETLGAVGPSLSVIVPNYNYSRYLRERLGSVFHQSAPIFEMIVLDDASQDDSLKEIEIMRVETKREFELIANDVNSGSVFAQWRRGLDRSGGELLWIAEADDSSHPEFLARMTALFRDPSVVFAFSDSKAIGPDGGEIWPSYKAYYDTVESGLLGADSVFEGREFLRRHLSVKNLILNVSGVVWRKSALAEVMETVGDDLKNLEMAGDWLIYAKACLRPGANVAYVSKPLNSHRRHSASVTHALNAEKHADEIRKMHGIINKWLGRSSSTPAQAAYVTEIVAIFDQKLSHTRH